MRPAFRNLIGPVMAAIIALALTLPVGGHAAADGRTVTNNDQAAIIVTIDLDLPSDGTGGSISIEGRSAGRGQSSR